MKYKKKREPELEIVSIKYHGERDMKICLVCGAEKELEKFDLIEIGGEKKRLDICTKCTWEMAEGRLLHPTWVKEGS
jgi:hypothetical protein